MEKTLSWYFERVVKYYFVKPKYKKEYGSFKKYCATKEKYDKAKGKLRG